MPLTDEQKAELKKKFDSFDVDKDGTISIAELKAVCESMGLNKSELEIAEYIDRADKDGSGTVDFDEYCQHYAEIDEQRMWELFQKYDTKNGTEEGNGYLDLEELTALVKDLNFRNIKKRTIKYFMKQLDTNGDKKISFEEFKAMNRTKLMKK
ncbi:PREDICTED: calmodulin-like [Amphimedon queenslandica]|uniref:EF-hand domain-containing protein n=1 Tax=Amphimedon queenslandica TaxID=400682 RepID=A0A1X7UDB9_AMPQE|nr:PREDICTED: calmodulin-like [Amphimedon queenslandica]|eukprot:XP_003388319.2 PREDICTED: calmodulin-like [Amphimedon queenslandica]